VVAARSALAHLRPDVEVVILGADLSPESSEFLCDHIGGTTIVTPVSSNVFDELPALERFPRTVWAILLLGSLLPRDAERVLWLDGDVLVRGPIDELLELPLEGMTMAASVDYWAPTHAGAAPGFWQAASTPPGAAYFNTGVLVVDLPSWRSLDVEGLVRDALARQPAIPTPNADQDILNAVLWDRWLPIPDRWNYPAQLVSRDSYRARIAHFFGARKPWKIACENSHLQREYATAAREIGWEVPGPSRSVRHLTRALLPPFVGDIRDRNRAKRLG
jgi:lipopolysaccharide biosynthesis glycosyltransferase